MTGVLLLIPVALGLGLLGLAAFFWAARNGQFEDLDTPALDVLRDEPPDVPAPDDTAGRGDAG